MIQDQLLDYISSQVKLGVSRDAIKSTLMGAGWAAADVDDTLKKVEESAVSTAKPAAPATAAVSPAASANPVSNMAAARPATAAASQPASASRVTGPAASGAGRSIAVSDLVSSTGSANSFFSKSSPAASAAAAKGQPVSQPAAQPMKIMSVSQGVAAAKTKSPIFSVASIIEIVIILGLGGLAGYLYTQNNALSTQVASIGSTSGSVASQVTSLNDQVQALNASNTALAAEVQTLTASNTALADTLSFLVVPAGAARTTSTVTVAGALSLSKGSYILTTPLGAVLTVQNSKDPKVDALLKPLLSGASSSVTLAGTHALGSALITVATVNVTSIEAPALAAPTSTASSTASTTTQ